MNRFPPVPRLGAHLLRLLLLAGLPTAVRAAEHTIEAWTDGRLAAGLPGITTADTLVLPASAAAGTTLAIPAQITSLTLRGRADYTDLTVKVAADHPGLALTIDGLAATGVAGGAALEFGNASASNHLTITGANLLVGGSGCAGLQVPIGAGVTVSGSGSLLARGTAGGAGIGSANGTAGSGTITIAGGTITAVGGETEGDYGGGAAGIGSGRSNTVLGDISITGGTIHATGGGGATGGAGIGQGRGAGSSGRIAVRNAIVTAIGRNGGAGIGAGYGCGGTEVDIVGSDITAVGGAGAAGIGGGLKSGGVLITITASTVGAEGGSLTNDDGTFGGAGIGSGGSGAGKAIRITGGTVVARGGAMSAGIGSGSKGGCAGIYLQDTQVTAVGGANGAGLGAGAWGGCEVLEVAGASVIGASGGTGGAGIGCGQAGGCRTIKLQAGEITATGGTGADAIGIGVACGTTGMRISRWAAAVVHAATISPTPLEVATGLAAASSTVEAAAAGEILCSGSSVVRERGFVYATESAPTLATGVRVPAGADMGAFAATLAGLTPGIAYHVRAYASNSTTTAYGADAVFTTPTSAGLLAAFLQAHGLDPASAADADPDGDGVGNLLEFVLGGDPLAGETGLLPAGSVVSGGGTPAYEYSFLCTREAAAGFAVTVEFSPDLATWTAAVAGQGGVTITRVSFAGGEAVTARIPVVGARLFVRLRVAPR